MDTIASKIADALIAQGPLGVIVVLLCIWIVLLQRRIDSVQEKRVADAFKIVEAANTVSSALDRNTETLRALIGRER
jgi:hypothetical protein